MMPQDDKLASYFLKLEQGRDKRNAELEKQWEAWARTKREEGMDEKAIQARLRLLRSEREGLY